MKNKAEIEFDSFLNDILKTLILLIPNAQTGSIQIREGNIVRFCTTYGYELEKLQQCTFKADTDLYLLAQTKKPNIIINLKEWDSKELKPDQLAILKKYGKLESIKCMLKFALFVDNEIWGYINIENHYTENAFSEKDVNIVERFRDITEKIIKAKIAYILIDKQFNELFESLERNYTLYDMYRHNLRNELQIQLMILGLNDDPTKDEIQSKIKDIDKLGKDLFIKKPIALTFLLTNQSRIEIKEIVVENHKQFTFLAGAKIRIYISKDSFGKRKTILNHNFEVNQDKYPEISDISYIFPLFQDYNVEIVLYFDETAKNDSYQEEKVFIERQLVLLYLINLQSRLFDYFYDKLKIANLHYKELLSFYNQHITPLTVLLDNVDIKKDKYEDKWLNSICTISEIISAIINLVDW